MLKSFTSRLFLLSVLAVLPLLIYTTFLINKTKDLEEKHARDSVALLLENFSKDTIAMLEDTDRLLLAITDAYRQSQNPRDFNTFLKNTLTIHEHTYILVGIANEAGEIISSHPSPREVVNISDRNWFQQLKKTKDRFEGSYLVERIAGHKGFIVGRALLKADHQFGGAVFAVVSMDYFKKLLENFKFPKSFVVTLRDPEGVILARNVEDETWREKSSSQSDIYQQFYKHKENGFFPAQGVDGVARLYAYRFIGKSPETGGIFISAGIDAKIAFGPARDLMVKNGFIFVSVVIVAFFLSKVFYKRFIFKPFEEVKSFIYRFLTERNAKLVARPSWPKEFKELAHVFNEMAQTISHQIDTIKASEVQYHTLVNQLPALLYRASCQLGERIVVKHAFFGRLMKDFVPDEKNTSWFDLIHVKDRERVLKELQYFLANGEEIFRSEYRIILGAEEIIWVRDEAIKLGNIKNGSILLQGIVRDISRRVEMENRIKILQRAFEEMDDAVGIFRNDRSLEWRNKSFLKLFNDDDIRSLDDLIPCFALDENLSAFMKGVEEKIPWRGLLSLFHSSEKGSSLMQTSLACLGEEEQSIYIIAMKDITNQIMQERKLLTVQKMESLGTLAAGIAHNFNNILMIIMGYADLASHELPEDSNIRPLLAEINQASLRAKDLVAQILGFCREEKGTDFMALPILHLVKESVKLLRQTLPTTVDVVFKSDLSLEDVVFGSPSEIQQIIMNLAINGVHAMNGEGTLTIKLIRTDPWEASSSRFLNLLEEKDSCALLCITDTGTGIDPSIINRIFDPYFTTKSPGVGTGIGLTMVYNTVKKMKGAIDVISEPGQGSSFRVFLPLQAKESEHSKTGSKNLDLVYPQKRPIFEKILIVDDNEDILKLLGKEPSFKKYKIFFFSNAPEAYAWFKEHPYDVDCIIADHQMSSLPGLEFCKKVLNLRSDLPCIIMTGYLDKALEDKATSTGVKRVLLKPFSIRDLLNTIDSIAVEMEPPFEYQEKL